MRSRPYKSIVDLKDFRDTLAHGKPKEVLQEIEVITTHEELAARGHLSADWEKYLSEEFVFDAYQDVNLIWNDLLKRSGLEVFDTLTGGGSVSLIDEFEE